VNHRYGLSIVFALFAGGVLLTAGCGQADNPGGQAQDPGQEKARAEGGPHSGWWCAEHGIPEEECSICNMKVAEQFKKKGDWCEQHDRAESQCFICNPSLKEKFAAKYRAKYGKEPPPSEGEHEDEKN
jgi:hypothetical protein